MLCASQCDRRCLTVNYLLIGIRGYASGAQPLSHQEAVSGKAEPYRTAAAQPQELSATGPKNNASETFRRTLLLVA